MSANIPAVPHYISLLIVTVFCFVSGSALAAQDLPECSLSKTNKSCKMIIDRSNPVAPSTVQMYSDQQVTLVITNPQPFERYFLDFTSGQAALTPDVASTVVQQLVPNLGHLQAIITAQTKGLPKTNKGCNDPNLTSGNDWPAKDGMAAAMPTFNSCFAVLSTLAIQAYRQLEPLVAPDSLTQQQPVPEPYYYRHNRCAILARIAGYITAEAVISTKISNVSKNTSYSVLDQDVITQLGEFQKLTDAIAADLAGYSQRITDLGPNGFGLASTSGQDTSDGTCSWNEVGKYFVGSQVVYSDKYYISLSGANSVPDKHPNDWLSIEIVDAAFLGSYDQKVMYKPGNQIVDKNGYWTCITGCTNPPPASSWMKSPAAESQPLKAIWITSRQDDQHIYENMVTRTITYSFDSLNLVSYSQESIPAATNKKSLATIAVSFADQPNGKFLGTPYTALRWEASAGVFFSWLPERTFTLTSTGSVQDAKTRPTPVPFAAANYRFTSDFDGRWKQNLYLTGAVGVNPNNTTAEFGAGISYAWRAFMVGPLCHFGHDVTPTKVSLTSGSASPLPTMSHWTEKLAIGISVRVPSLTGR